MAAVKKPHTLAIKPGSDLYEIVDQLRTSCGTEQFNKKIRKATSSTLLEGLVSALCETADASTLNRLVDQITKEDQGEKDRRGEFVAKIIEARNASAFGSLPSTEAEIDKLMKELAARKEQLTVAAK